MAEITKNILARVTIPYAFHWTPRNMVLVCWDSENIEICEIPVIDKCNHSTTNLLNMEKATKKLLHKNKKGRWQLCGIVFECSIRHQQLAEAVSKGYSGNGGNHPSSLIST